MNPELISKIKPAAHKPEWDKAILAYAEYREEQLFRALLQVDEMTDVTHLRGAIDEIRKLKRLKEDIKSYEDGLKQAARS